MAPRPQMTSGLLFVSIILYTVTQRPLQAGPREGIANRTSGALEFSWSCTRSLFHLWCPGRGCLEPRFFERACATTSKLEGWATVDWRTRLKDGLEQEQKDTLPVFQPCLGFLGSPTAKLPRWPGRETGPSHPTKGWRGTWPEVWVEKVRGNSGGSSCYFLWVHTGTTCSRLSLSEMGVPVWAHSEWSSNPAWDVNAPFHEEIPWWDWKRGMWARRDGIWEMEERNLIKRDGVWS